jgi:hypothetical protein
MATRKSADVVAGSIGVVAFLILALVVQGAPPPAFTAPIRLGFPAGDDWEPSVATFGSTIYVGWMHAVPGEFFFRIFLQVSTDGGSTFSAPVDVAPSLGADFADVWVLTDAAGVVYISFIAGNFQKASESNVFLVKSFDGGRTFTAPVEADGKAKAQDKPVMGLRGSDVYIAHASGTKLYVSSSHDSGATWSTVFINPNQNFGVGFPAGVVVNRQGHVFVAWDATSGAPSVVNILVSKSTDGGATWTNTLVDAVPPPPDCPVSPCGFAFFSAQNPISIDANDVLYMTYNAPNTKKGPPRLYFTKSTDGVAWTPRMRIDSGDNNWNAFPAMASCGANDVRVSWYHTTDPTGTSSWDIFYRTSGDGGATFASITRVTVRSFPFPYGDYHGHAVDGRCDSHLAWGEGPDWLGPGNTFYSHN